MMQPDFGTAVIYFGMLFALLYWAGATRFILLAVVAPPAAALGALLGTTAFLIVVAVFGVLLYITKEHRLVAAVVFSVMVLVGHLGTVDLRRPAPLSAETYRHLPGPERRPAWCRVQHPAVESGHRLGRTAGQGLPARITDTVELHSGAMDGLHLLCAGRRVRVSRQLQRLLSSSAYSCSGA